jgi:ribosomal protein S18 acetylase RimI-like enzyme
MTDYRVRPAVWEESDDLIARWLLNGEYHRRQGLGRMLVQDLVAWFREKGARTVELSMAAKNELGDQFWSALGFETLLVRKVLRLT